MVKAQLKTDILQSFAAFRTKLGFRCELIAAAGTIACSFELCAAFRAEFGISSQWGFAFGTTGPHSLSPIAFA